MPQLLGDLVISASGNRRRGELFVEVFAAGVMRRLEAYLEAA
jgi:hypothetical protein